MKHFLQKYREVIILCIISLFIRLVVMPYAQSNDSDATCRVFDARNLIDNFRLIMSGHWAPLHSYFNALILLIIPDNVYGPEILSILFAVLSCIPLYFFTKNEFNKQGAFFVTLIYSFSPVVFRNSFLAMAEVCYAFFILLSLCFLSKGIREQQKIRYAIYAGMSLTIAGGVRYEAWEVMAIFAIILLLYKQWKMIIPFCITSLIFPVYWMIGNQIEQKDFLYSFHYATNWINNVAHYNDNLTKVELIKRFSFFPISWFLMLTPLISLVLIFSLLIKLIKKKINKKIAIWFIPFLVFLTTYTYSAYKGTLYTQHRFSITLVLFSVPFYALFFENEKNIKWKKILTLILIGLMIPLSFCWNKIPYYKLYKNFPSLSYVLEQNVKFDEAIPLINDKAIDAISCGVNYLLNDKKGLVLDFIGCEKTYYIALNTRSFYKNIYLFYENPGEKINVNNLNIFFEKYQEGLIMIKAYSQLDNICHSIGSIMEIENSPYQIYLEKCIDISNIKLFKYYVKTNEWANNYKLKNQNAKGITFTEKNKEYYSNEMRCGNWLIDEERKAKDRNLTIDEMIYIDAQWMVTQDSLNAQKDSIILRNNH